MQCAMVALWSKGYRTSTSEPGHHQTAIQILPRTLGVDAATVVVLDALRKQRNLSDYTGETISEAALEGCIVQAEGMLALARKHCERGLDVSIPALPERMAEGPGKAIS